jgi:predicted acetyltransferase
MLVSKGPAGRVLPSMGLAAVACMPQFRRRGCIRTLMTVRPVRVQLSAFTALTGVWYRACVRMQMALEWAHREKMALSSLYPFKESFYERLGYATLVNGRTYVFDPHVLSPLLRKKLGIYLSRSR